MELLDNRQYWWWAEKKRSPRLNYLRKGIWSKATKGSSYLPGVQMDLENFRWHTKIFKEAPASEPFIITRARSLEALLGIYYRLLPHTGVSGFCSPSYHMDTDGIFWN
ncbi:MAG: hypothetical protein SWO11_19470 [Thermodesulfobacteriota bacterium]|nr:hypothetical protein [Thermodesulfobacteriota bacterium]